MVYQAPPGLFLQQALLLYAGLFVPCFFPGCTMFSAACCFPGPPVFVGMQDFFIQKKVSVLPAATGAGSPSAGIISVAAAGCQRKVANTKKGNEQKARVYQRYHVCFQGKEFVLR